MALFKRAEQAGPLVTGLVVGVATLALAPILLPTLARVGRPVVKAAIKGAILAYQTGRETLAELAEVAEDLLAEARAELAREEEAERAVQAAAAGARATGTDG